MVRKELYIKLYYKGIHFDVYSISEKDLSLDDLMKDLPDKQQKSILARIYTIANIERGRKLPDTIVRPIRRRNDTILELKGNDVRALFFRDGNKMIISHVLKKPQPKVLRREADKAIEIKNRYFEIKERGIE